MKTIIGNILFAAALILILARFLSVWAGTPFPVDLVTSDSMDPALMKGDVVVWTPTKMEDIKVGDVVVYKSYLHWPDEKLVVHRVSEIRYDSRGNKILETKGDNNEYPDQEGPHIPEPYIREEHLMGKAVSIGQMPFKIPFVGYIGIWINEGIELISQPANSKESLAYAGIFTPLTISSVILIALIIVVPERAKTIKQKIRLHRFGPKQSDLGKTILMFLVAYFVFFTIIHCFAFDSVTASVGINDDTNNSNIEFGRIIQGTESLPQDLPLINPSISTVKGVIYGQGELEEYASRHVFELQPGETKVSYLTASASNSSKNGSYIGEINIYSSPFWILYPDSFMADVLSWNPNAVVYILDFLSALILTTITAIILVSITLIFRAFSLLSINYSWRFAPRLIIRKKTAEKIGRKKANIKKALSKKLGWILKTNLAETEDKEKPYQFLIKPILASLVIIPILYFIGDELLSMFFAVIIAGLLAYFTSCKIRSKIILTTLITMTIVMVHMMIQSNLIIFEKENELIETLSFSFGAIGIYLLVFGLLLIPLSMVSWFLVGRIRNVKEQKDPLLVLEGKCDL